MDQLISAFGARPARVLHRLRHRAQRGPAHGGPRLFGEVGRCAEHQGRPDPLALSPVTGKKHQLRVHMNALGLPLVNDRVYPPVDVTPDDDFRHPLQLLAKSIAFVDPVAGEARRLESRLVLRELPA